MRGWAAALGSEPYQWHLKSRSFNPMSFNPCPLLPGRVLEFLTSGDRALAAGRGLRVRQGNYAMRTLLFQENQDTLLEVQRSQALDEAAIRIQRVLRGYTHRCRPCPKPLPTHTSTRPVPWAGLYPLNQGDMFPLVSLWG